MSLYKILFVILLLVHVCLGAPTDLNCHIVCDRECRKKPGSTDTREYDDCMKNKVLCFCKEEEDDIRANSKAESASARSRNLQRQGDDDDDESSTSATANLDCSEICAKYWWAIVMGVVSAIGLILGIIICICIRMINRHNANNIAAAREHPTSVVAPVLVQEAQRESELEPSQLEASELETPAEPIKKKRPARAVSRKSKASERSPKKRKSKKKVVEEW